MLWYGSGINKKLEIKTRVLWKARYNPNIYVYKPNCKATYKRNTTLCTRTGMDDAPSFGENIVSAFVHS